MENRIYTSCTSDHEESCTKMIENVANCPSSGAFQQVPVESGSLCKLISGPPAALNQEHCRDTGCIGRPTSDTSRDGPIDQARPTYPTYLPDLPTLPTYPTY